MCIFTYLELYTTLYQIIYASLKNTKKDAHGKTLVYSTLRGVIRNFVDCIKSTYASGTINGTLPNGRKKSAIRTTKTKAVTVMMRSVNCDGSNLFIISIIQLLTAYKIIFYVKLSSLYLTNWDEMTGNLPFYGF